MTRLLILAYDFPPYVSVGGLRPYSWYKYLYLYDIYPIVVTRQWENKLGNELDYISPSYSDSIDKEITSEGTVIKVPFKPTLANRILLKYGKNKFKVIRRLITAYYEFLQFIFPIGSKKKIYSAADEYIKDNPVDCIIATGDPFILYKYASKLGRKYSIPWIADYRDPWIQDNSMKNNPVYRIWCAFFERRFLKNVHRVTTVSTFIQKQLEQNLTNKSFEILINGYDPEIIEATRDIEQTNDILSIGFSGTVSDWHPIESFLRVCNEALAKSADFKLNLNFYGINKEKEIRETLSENYKLLEQYTHFHPRMDNLKFAKSIATQNVCLLFNDYSILGTKIFDYLAVKRKIILCYENDKEALELKKQFFSINELETESKRLQAEMISATNSGIVVNDSEQLREIIEELGKELKETGFINCSSVNVDKYSRIKQVERLAEIVKKPAESNK